MYRVGKQILLGVVLALCWAWFSAAFAHWVLPDDWNSHWYALPTIFTLVIGGACSYVGGCVFPFKDKP